MPQFKEICQPLDARKDQIEEEIPRIEAEMDLVSIDSLSSDHIMSSMAAGESGCW
jgi:hypothetical protein